MKKATFYHAGCPVCVTAERQFVAALDPKEYQVKVVYPGQTRQRISQAQRAGVKSVTALVIDGQPFYINFGAALKGLK